MKDQFQCLAPATLAISRHAHALHREASSWENGYNESFKGKLRDELLNEEILYTLAEARILIERWRQHYNTKRPHSALGYRPQRQKRLPRQAGPSASLRFASPPARHQQVP